MSDQKSKFETELEALAPEQFAKVREAVTAEHLKRDNGANEQEHRRKLAQMTDAELRRYTRENYGY